MFDEIGKLEKLYRQHPQSPLFARLADLYLRQGKVGRALEVCQEGCRRFPNYPTGHLILGKCYEVQGQLEEARTATDRALRLDPENPAGFRRLSRIYQALGISTLALKSLQQAASFDPLSRTLAEEVDRLAYAVRVESTAPLKDKGIADIPPEPVVKPVALVPEEPEAREAVLAAPASSAAETMPSGGEPFAAIQPLPEWQAAPAREEEREESLFEESASPEILPLEESIEALFRRGEEAEESLFASREETAPPLAEGEPPPRRAVPPKAAHPSEEVSEDLLALGAEVLADDSLLQERGEAEAQEEPAGDRAEEGIFPAADRREAPAPTPEEALFAPAGEEETASVALPPGESAADLWLGDLAGEPAEEEAPPTAVIAAPQKPGGAEERAESAVETPAAGRPAGPGLSRRQDDEELIRLFQEIESQQHLELATRQPLDLPVPAAPAPPPGAGADQESRIATVTLAQIYASQGFADRAIETYKQVLEQDPHNETIRRKIEELQQGRKTA